ncbi:MAG: class I SAM-dependent methyltransferase [Dehalogenimonas sp.]
MTEKIKTSKETAARWERVYKTNPVTSLPWEEGAPSSYLIELIESGVEKPGPVLDICTGSGNNAIYLAQHGYSCHAVDISLTAISIAREKADKAGTVCDFRVGDVLNLDFPNDMFGLVFDRGCFHNFAPEQRSAFIREIYRVLKPDGLYQLNSFSKKGHDWGGPPYGFSPAEIRKLFRASFEILWIKEISLEGGVSGQFFLSALMKKADRD